MPPTRRSPSPRQRRVKRAAPPPPSSKDTTQSYKAKPHAPQSADAAEAPSVPDTLQQQQQQHHPRGSLMEDLKEWFHRPLLKINEVDTFLRFNKYIIEGYTNPYYHYRRESSNEDGNDNSASLLGQGGAPSRNVSVDNSKRDGRIGLREFIFQFVFGVFKINNETFNVYSHLFMIVFYAYLFLHPPIPSFFTPTNNVAMTDLHNSTYIDPAGITTSSVADLHHYHHWTKIYAGTRRPVPGSSTKGGVASDTRGFDPAQLFRPLCLSFSMTFTVSFVYHFFMPYCNHNENHYLVLLQCDVCGIIFSLFSAVYCYLVRGMPPPHSSVDGAAVAGGGGPSGLAHRRDLFFYHCRYYFCFAILVVSSLLTLHILVFYPFQSFFLYAYRRYIKKPALFLFFASGELTITVIEFLIQRRLPAPHPESSNLPHIYLYHVRSEFQRRKLAYFQDSSAKGRAGDSSDGGGDFTLLSVSNRKRAQIFLVYVACLFLSYYLLIFPKYSRYSFHLSSYYHFAAYVVLIAGQVCNTCRFPENVFYALQKRLKEDRECGVLVRFFLRYVYSLKEVNYFGNSHNIWHVCSAFSTLLTVMGAYYDCIEYELISYYSQP